MDAEGGRPGNEPVDGSAGRVEWPFREAGRSTVLHYSLRTGPVSSEDLDATLDAVADALAV